MFGIGLGEILLVLLIIFIVSPREIPKVMKKIGELARTLDKLKREFADAGKEVMDDKPATKQSVIKRPASKTRRAKSNPNKKR